MARKAKDGATGTVQARAKAEAERQKAAATLRQNEIDATTAAQKATAKRLKDKPTDTRTLATPDPNA
jgi:hypothetical protein